MKPCDNLDRNYAIDCKLLINVWKIGNVKYCINGEYLLFQMRQFVVLAVSVPS